MSESILSDGMNAGTQPERFQMEHNSRTMNNSENGFIHNPAYSVFFEQSFYYFQRQFQHITHEPITLETLSRELGLLARHVTPSDVTILFAATIFIAFARHFLTNYVFKPICKWRQIPEKSAEKMPESAWKLLFYLSTWTAIATYMFTVPGMNFLQHPEYVWQNYSIANPVEAGIYWIYAMELGYYFHSLYTTIAVDERRKDTAVMMLHHLLTILLMTISYSNRCHKSGFLVLFLHDGCDVFLEGTKLMKYFKVQNGKVYNRLEMFVNAGFVGFVLSWMFCRLYWFPLKQVYYASVYVEHLKLQVPFFFALNFMLWVLLILNVYWFSFAMVLLFNVLTGKQKEIDDTREFDKTFQQSEKVYNDRKYSCDSGLADSADSSTEGTPIDSNTPDRTTPVPVEESSDDAQQNLSQTDIASLGYNLRHRK